MKSRLQVIREYFEMSSKECMVEYKELNDEERNELAVLAAKELNLSEKEVDFKIC